jgi:hypothetical protein
MARSLKMRPRTKHLNIKYHHFREAVKAGDITIYAISTDDELADIFTKPLALMLFNKFRNAIMGWTHEEVSKSVEKVSESVEKVSAGLSERTVPQASSTREQATEPNTGTVKGPVDSDRDTSGPDCSPYAFEHQSERRTPK